MTKTLFAIVGILTSVSSLAGGLAPWAFGMSPADVSSFTAQGPYRPFQNGDLETYNGRFAGRTANVQFFFQDQKLRRIGVYMYEGQDANEARNAWQLAYKVFRDTYGDVEIPQVHVTSSSDFPPIEALALAVAANADVTGKTQMAPKVQPSDEFVFSSFLRQKESGSLPYLVIVYLDQRN